MNGNGINGIKITGLHTLRTPKLYDYSAYGEYHHFIFARYRDGRYTGESWSGVVKETELFRLLKQAGHLKKEVETRREP